MKVVSQIFIKHSRRFFKNISIIIIFFICPVIAAFIKFIVYPNREDVTILFIPLHLVLSGALAVGCLITDEKERRTLHVLLKSGVSMQQFLLGTGLFAVIFEIVGCLLLFFIGEFSLTLLPQYGLFAFIGTICSALLGCILGLALKTQTQVNILVIPIVFVIGLFPILGLDNPVINEVAKVFFTYEVLSMLAGQKVMLSSWIIMFSNIVVLMLILLVEYNYVQTKSNFT